MVRRILSQLHRYVLWLLVSTVFWAWIFTFLTDAPQQQKIVLYADTPAIDGEAMAEALSDPLPDGIRLVQVHPFSYALFDSTEPMAADLYILSDTEIAAYLDRLLPWPETDGTDGDYTVDGCVYGRRIYDKQTHSGTAGGFVTYTAQGQPEENYYLCFNRNSVHLKDADALSSAAPYGIACRILQMP